MSAPTLFAPTAPLGSLVILELLATLYGAERVARTLPTKASGKDGAPVADLATLAGGFVVLATSDDSAARLPARTTSGIVEFYCAPRSGGNRLPWNSAEELADRLVGYAIERLAARRRLVLTIPRRGRVLVSQLQLGTGSNAVSGDLGSVARADRSLALTWRPLPAATTAG